MAGEFPFPSIQMGQNSSSITVFKIKFFMVIKSLISPSFLCIAWWFRSPQGLPRGMGAAVPSPLLPAVFKGYPPMK